MLATFLQIPFITELAKKECRRIDHDVLRMQKRQSITQIQSQHKRDIDQFEQDNKDKSANLKLAQKLEMDRKNKIVGSLYWEMWLAPNLMITV